MKRFLLSCGLILAASAAMAQTAITQTPMKDPGVFDKVTLTDGSSYVELENNWIYSSIDGFKNYPTGLGTNTRSMAYANGKVYIPEKRGDDLGKLYLHIFDAATGNYTKTVSLPDQIFKNAENAFVFGPLNTITTDSEGRLVFANLCTDFQAGPLQVWVMEDENDTNPVKVLDFTQPLGETLKMRVDFIEVYGNLKSGKAQILAGLSSTPYIAKFDIVDGAFNIDGGPDGDGFMYPDVETNPTILSIEGKTVPKEVLQLSTAPLIYPISDTQFYLDGHTTYPTLYDWSGNMKDGFYDAAGDVLTTIAPAQNVNGFADVLLGSEIFLVSGKTAYNVATNPSSFVLYHQNEANISPNGAKIAYTNFPSTGLGASQNTSAIMLPRIHYVNDLTAEIYIFAQNNGFAKYTLKLNGGGSSVLEDQLEAVSVSVIGDEIVATESVASIDVYSVTGQKVASVKATDRVAAPAAGIYVVTTVDNSGVVTSHKVLVK